MSQQKTNAFGGVLGASHGDAQRRVKFSFDVNDAIYSRDGEDNLIIEQGDSHLVFNDFFVTDGKELPEIELLDGTIVDGATFLASMNPDMDLTTAMGSIATPDSGGTEYSDGGGQLIDGTDSLLVGEGLGQWNRGLLGGGLPDPLSVEPLLTPAVGGGEQGETEEGLSHMTTRTITHDTSRPTDDWSYSEYKSYSDGYEYDAGLVTEHFADALEGGVILNAAGSVIIEAGGGVPTGDAPVYVGGIFATEGGAYKVVGDTVDISASASGVEEGSATPSTTVAGVWGHGTHHSQSYSSPNEEGEQPSIYKRYYQAQSKVEITSEKELVVKADIIGSTEKYDTSESVYIGAAATDGGVVRLVSQEGSVTVNATNNATGADVLSTGGVYGLFSGYGANTRDFENSLASDAEVAANVKDAYLQWLHEGFTASRSGKDKWANDEMVNSEQIDYEDGTFDIEEGCWPELSWVPKISLVDVVSKGGVNVNVDLGGHDYQGAASGIKNYLGDVYVRAFEGNINVSVEHDGVHVGGAESKDYISAIEKNAGRIILAAGGYGLEDSLDSDINLSVASNGENIAVLRYANGEFAEPLYDGGVHGQGGEFYNASYISMTAANINLVGTAGKNGADVYNSVAGIDADNGLVGRGHILNFKTRQQDEERSDTIGVTIDATAYDNGAGASSSGISLVGQGGEQLHLFYQSYGGGSVKDTGVTVNSWVAGSGKHEDSVAKGIFLQDATMNLTKGDFVPNDIMDNPHWGWDIPNEDDMEFSISSAEYISSLNVNVGGAKKNYGLQVYGTDLDRGDTDIPALEEYKLNVAAHKIDIEVTGRESDSTSYGIHVQNDSADNTPTGLYLVTDDFSLKTHGAQDSVGIHVEDINSCVRIFGNGHSGANEPFRLEIHCSLEGSPEGVFDGIAIEAFNKGDVSIQGREQGSFMNINGHLIAETEGRILLSGDSQQDIFTINGKLSAADGGKIEILCGEGDDLVHLNGAVSNDNATIDIRGQAGNDILILQAPDAETFELWYSSWLTDVFQNNVKGLSVFGFEAIVIKGAGDATPQWLADLLKDSGIEVAYDNSNSELTNEDYQGLFDEFFPSPSAAESRENPSAQPSSHASDGPEGAYSPFSMDNPSVDNDLESLHQLMQILNG